MVYLLREKKGKSNVNQTSSIKGLWCVWIVSMYEGDLGLKLHCFGSSY